MSLNRIFRTVTLAALLCVAAVTNAANVRWIGQANDVAQEDTITVANTWAADDTVTIAINNQSLTITIGSDVSTTAVADVIARAINANSATQNLLNDETRTRGGQEIPEFKDVIAEVDGAVVTVRSRVAGVPFETTSGTSSLVVTESTAGTGTATEALSVSATGREHFDNGDNWSGGAVPSASDKIFFDSGPSCLYGLENTTLNYDLYVTQGYGESHIGLPRRNPLGYDEYRVRFLTIEATATTGSCAIEIGVPTGSPTSQQGRRYIDTGSNDSLVNAAYVHSTGPRGVDGAPVQFVGGKDFICEVISGSCDIGTHEDETAVEIAAVRTNGATADLRIGNTTTFTNAAGTIECNAGSLSLEASCDGTSNTIDVNGGTLTVAIADVLLRDVEVRGGRLTMGGVEFNNLSIFDGGVVDLTRASANLTFNNDIELFRGFTIIDPRALYQSNYDFNGCTPSDGTFRIQSNVRLTLTPL